MRPRERSFSASVFSSTRRQPQTSKAWSSISSFASTLTPVPHADGWSHVQPISTTPCSGRSARKRVEPTSATARDRSSRTEAPPRLRRARARRRATRRTPRASRVARIGSQRHVARVARGVPQTVGVRGREGLETGRARRQRRWLPRLHRADVTLGACRSTSTRAWSARRTSRSSFAATSRSSPARAAAPPRCCSSCRRSRCTARRRSRRSRRAAAAAGAAAAPAAAGSRGREHDRRVDVLG